MGRFIDNLRHPYYKIERKEPLVGMLQNFFGKLPTNAQFQTQEEKSEEHIQTESVANIQRIKSPRQHNNTT